MAKNADTRTLLSSKIRPFLDLKQDEIIYHVITKALTMKKKKGKFKSAVDGRYISKDKAQKSPRETYKVKK